MSDFGDGSWITGRKPHRCGACLGPIPKGERHYHYKGMYDGAWQNWRMHKECFTDYDLNGDGEFMPGDYPVPPRLITQAEDAATGCKKT